MGETRQHLENRLRRAVANDEFILHYQPQAALASGRVAALEALIRWDSPEAGLLYPGEFLPLAEQSDLIHDIGDWVVEAVCAQLHAWRDKYGLYIPVALNFAMREVSEQHVIRLESLLKQYDIEPKYIELELTEDATMADPETSVALMRRLKKAGVSLAIDDFGLGYSNLAYLKRFPVDKLKLDMQFTRGLINSIEDRAVTAAIIRLANNLGLRTVAESVEREGQLRFLLDEQCDAMQGYYFSPPMEAEAVPAFLMGGTRLDLSAVRRRPYSRRLILISDDVESLRGFRTLAEAEGFELIGARNVGEALEVLACKDVSVVVGDVTRGGECAITALETVRRLYPAVMRVLATAADTPLSFPEAINRAQPYKHIARPWHLDKVAPALQDVFRQFESALLPPVGTPHSLDGNSDIDRWRPEVSQVLG